MLCRIWRINLNQEAIPKDSQLKKSKNHEVSVGIGLNIWLVPRFYHGSSLFHKRCFILSATGSVNNGKPHHVQLGMVKSNSII